MNVRAILNSSWQYIDIFAESVPHLLHYDLTYLWLLERDASKRPSSWTSLLEAWERLLFHFLLGTFSAEESGSKNTIEEETLTTPFLDFTRPFGITSIQKLIYDSVPVGLVSPVCIVRPLPDEKGGLLNSLPDIRPKRPEELRFFLTLLDQNLETLAATRNCRLHKSLSTVVSRLLSQLPDFSGGKNTQVWDPVPFKLRLLGDVGFTETTSDSAAELILIDTSSTRSRYVYVPRCQCGKLLTTTDDPAAAVNGDVQDGDVVLACPDSHNNQIPLKNFLIWKRANEVICWSDRELSSLEPRYFPPEVTIEEDMACFRWQSAYLDGEAKRTALRIRFKHPVRKVAKSDALYSTVLIPGGDATSFEGIPVRPEYADAWTGAKPPLRLPNHLRYEGVELRGWPFSIRHEVGKGDLRPAPDLRVGVYPKQMPPEWRWYRAYLDADDLSKYRIRCSGGSGTNSKYFDETTEWPAWVAVEDLQGKAGALWKLPKASGRPGTQDSVAVGVDFGTTNTVIYFAREADTKLISTEENALNLKDIPQLVHWISADSGASREAWFLPDVANVADPAQIPSAVWTTAERDLYAIRWSVPWNSTASTIPQHDPRRIWVPVRGFKWDDQGRDCSAERLGFLRELFFFALPAIWARLEGPPAALPSFSLGFSYPLAFQHQQREAYGKLLAQLASEIGSRSRNIDSTVAINESIAAVTAFGAPSSGDMFLVADLGGRTLDVSLLEYINEPQKLKDPNHYEQLGSVDFGGEAFLDAICGSTTTSKGEQYWQLRDRLAQQRNGSMTFPNGDAVLNRFVPMALEFLRVMIAAYREKEAAQQQANGETVTSRKIQVLLVGNGWRLMELRAGNRDPGKFSEDYYAQALTWFGDKNVALYPTRNQSVRNTKHWVAVGALKNLRNLKTNELVKGSEVLCKLPSGRKIVAGGETVEWHTLLGTGGWMYEKGDTELSANIKKIQVDGPAVPATWDGHLQRALDPVDQTNLENQIRETLQLVATRSNGRLEKGPLTILMENHWKPSL